MCFSATASFVAGGSLIVAGGASLKIAKKSDRLLAFIPLFFGIQQSIEGFQWLALNRGDASYLLAYAFLFFGFLLWPVYVPLALFMADKSRRKILRWFIGLGGVVALLYFIGLIVNPLTVSILNKSVCYKIAIPTGYIASGLYFISVFGALMVSSKKYFRWMGVVILITAVVAEVFFLLTFASVWCFFAAIVSALVYFYIRVARNSLNPVQ